MQGAVEAAVEGLIEPTLIGDEAAMKALAAKIGVDIGPYPMLDADTEARQRSWAWRCAAGQCAGDDEGQPAYR